MNMLVGYARVSTNDQNLDLQEEALKQAGCKKIIVDRITGTSIKRPGLEKLNEILRRGDTLMVWKLDRLGRSLQHLIGFIKNLEEQEIGFKSLQESIDSNSSTGKLIFHIFSALAEFERDLIHERTMAGLMSAKKRGKIGGRPKHLDQKQQQTAIKMYQSQKHTVKEICSVIGVSKPTLYRYLKQSNIELISQIEAPDSFLII